MAAGARVRRVASSDHVVGWAFAFPAVFLIVLFGIVPIIWSGVLSFQKSNLLSPPQWVGLRNYQALAHDPIFKSAATHSVIYTMLFVPLSVAGGLLTAVALNRKIRGVRWYRTAVFVPVVVSTIAEAIVFLWVFDRYFGLANWLLGKVGLGPYGFFDSPNGALYSIVGMTVWGWIGFDVIVYLAALQGIPPELVEAAEIDGAGTAGIFRNVTIPLLGPVTLFLVVWSSINALQLFDEVYLATNGGPAGSTNVLVLYLYKLAFQEGLAGYAAAIAYILFVAILVLTVVQLLVGKRLVHYSA
jgi:multiple sugar transport system permease protein